MLLGLVEVIALEEHRRAVAPGGLHLGEGSARGHDDGAGDAEVAGRQGDALGVVAGAGGDDARGLLFGSQGGDLVGGAADLEGARPLEVLGLEEEVAPRQPAEGVGGQHGRPERQISDDAPRPVDVLQGYRRPHPRPPVRAEGFANSVHLG